LSVNPIADTALAAINGTDTNAEDVRQIPAIAMSGSEQSVESSYQDNSLLRLIVESGCEVAGLIDECVELHNRRSIDLLSIIESAEFEAISGHDFFVVQDFYRHAMPRLSDVPVERMMRCTDALVRKGGGDLMANRPNEAIVEWLRADKTRASVVVTEAREGDAVALGHLTFALQAIGDLKIMRELLADENTRVRLAALTAISRTPHSDDGERGKTVRVVSSLVGAADEDTHRAHIVAALLLPFVQAKATPTNEALSAARRATETCGAATVHIAGQVLLAAGGWCPVNLAEVLLDALRHVEASSKGTIDLIDVGLCALLKGDCSEAAVKYVDDVVQRDEDPLPIVDFNSFVRDWVKRRKDLVDRTVALWLASGKRLLCQSVDALVSEGNLQGSPFDIDVGKLGLTPTQQYFMCGKAIGYLFMKPVSAASILVSTLRTADAGLAEAIKDLLFDPLLVSYSGTTLEYLEALPKTDPAHAHVADVLARTREYLDGLNAAAVMRELHPSEYQRQLERIRDANLNREIRKSAEKHSILRDIVHKSVLLHGSGSVTFVESASGERRPVHMKLHAYSATGEWPRMETVDPVGLDVVLRTLRAGQLKA